MSRLAADRLDDPAQTAGYLKNVAVEKDADISALVRAAVDDYFERHEKL